MKVGKVFEKLQAHKNVHSIEFGETLATVTLKDGSKLICKTAHEARLFIEKGEQPAGSLVEVPAPKGLTLEPVIAAAAKCGTEAKTITVDANWVIEHTGGTVRVPEGATQVRVTPRTLAAIAVGSLI
jgi:hypothetical protein